MDKVGGVADHLSHSYKMLTDNILDIHNPKKRSEEIVSDWTCTFIKPDDLWYVGSKFRKKNQVDSSKNIIHTS